MRTIITTCLALAIFSIAQFSQAQTVTTFIDIDPDGPGTFNIRLSSSLGDNDGIVSYAVTLTGDVTGYDHNAAVAQFASAPDAGGVGFGFVRTPDGSGPEIFSASQFAGPGGNLNLIGGFGQTASDFAASGITVVSAGGEPQAWDAELLVASGTYDVNGALPGVDLGATSFTVWSPFGTNGSGTIIGAPDTLTETRQDGGGGVSPTAIFANAPYSVGTPTTPGDAILPLTLDASLSTGDGPLSFDWDLDGNGSFETPGGSSPTLL